ncbi:MAG: 4'-phosphopantetheinyl transferase family protein [Chitinophagaceae bacterium]
MQKIIIIIAFLLMPIFYQQIINQYTKLAIWKIEEDESYFINTVPLQQHITHPHKRLQHLAGRFLLRYLFPSFPYSEIQIASTRKPFLANEAFHFSISHCNDFAAAIVSTKQRVGIDIEQIDKKVFKIVHKYLNENERLNFDLLSFENEHKLSNQLKVATLLWSVKESLFKWYGLGNVDFKSMLHLQFQPISENGSINASIELPSNSLPLQVNYAFFRNLCLSYVVE